MKKKEYSRIYLLPLPFPCSAVQWCSAKIVSRIYFRHALCQSFNVFGRGLFCCKVKWCLVILIVEAQALLLR